VSADRSAPRRPLAALLALALVAGGCGPGAQPLIAAAAKGDNASVRELLGRGAKPGRAGAEGLTPLMAAAQGGHTETVRSLLDAGADVNARRGGSGKGRTALIDAAGAGHVEIVRLLLAKGADPNARAERETTALMGAAQGG
jgi:uncharacterized protein